MKKINFKNGNEYAGSYSVKTSERINTNLPIFKIVAGLGAFMEEEDRDFIFNLIAIKDDFAYQCDFTTRNKKKIIKETIKKLDDLFIKSNNEHLSINKMIEENGVLEYYSNPIYLTVFMAQLIGRYLGAIMDANNIRVKL